MTKRLKITVLWLLTICGFASHTITDLLPMFWGKDIAMSADGVVPQGMILMMVGLSFLIPTCGIFCMLAKRGVKALGIINVVLAVLVALFNIMHAFMELPTDNAGQYIVMPLMILIGCDLAYQSIVYLLHKEE